MTEPVRVYLEVGEKSAFAAAIDWPGWCRRGRSSDLALDALEAYRARYRAVVGLALDGDFEVLDSLEGNATTDFGAPSAWGPWDEAPVGAREIARLVGALGDCWSYFDGVVARAPTSLTKGPRGGGRDRDAVRDHVREAERSYASKIGARIAPRTPWAAQRASISEALLAPGATRWPAPYAVRRMAWHVTDHAWEIEDRSGT